MSDVRVTIIVTQTCKAQLEGQTLIYKCCVSEYKTEQ